jgi:hypothetical protein
MGKRNDLQQIAPLIRTLLGSGLCFRTVLFGVGFRSFGSMMSGMMKMALGCLCVMRGSLVVIFFVVTGRLAMVASRVLMMFSSFAMMFCGLFGHGVYLYFHFFCG